ncbi:hypothetical protein [Roseicyclus persicicus]|uniref:Uncharacterized protein n=1 Tax=Roseicyclus persicicus TaxID=2650661 RepID=A0A7X6H0N9_9RHOB|nr:hypothetical protein [Roseibacterium persicicum]NKX45876.1 hypothetical protein [Roseibacterium persicicum]
MDQFAWRPAALRGERRVTVTPEGFAVDGGTVTCWDAVEAISFALDQAPRMKVTMMTLRLRVAGADVVLSVNGDGPEVARYVDMLRALTGALAAARPGMTITIGHEGGARWGMFAVGALGVLAGLFLIGVGVVLSVEGDWGEGVGMGFTGVVVSLVCAAIALSNLPRGARPASPLSEFHAELGLPDS